MSKQLNISMTVGADTSQARAQLQELQNQLTALGNTRITANPVTKLGSDLQQGVTAATQLQAALTAATNVNTGKLNLGKFNAELKQSGLSLQGFQQRLAMLGPE